MEDAFYQAMVDHPQDAAPKLVFSDWWDERGDVVAAEAFRWAAKKRIFPGQGYEGDWHWTTLTNYKPTLPFELPMWLFTSYYRTTAYMVGIHPSIACKTKVGAWKEFLLAFRNAAELGAWPRRKRATENRRQRTVNAKSDG